MSQYRRLLAYAREHGYSAAQARAAWGAVGGRPPKVRDNPGPWLPAGLLILAAWWLHSSHPQATPCTAPRPHFERPGYAWRCINGRWQNVPA